MNTIQSQLVKHRNLISNLRHTNSVTTKEEKMAQQEQVSRSTGGQGSNKRYKRSPEELLADINKVDELVASGKYNQIEALNAVGLQSSVYHYKKRQLNENVAKSLKPRKFAPRPNRVVNQESYEARKQELLKKLDAPKNEVIETKKAEKDETAALKAELAEFKAKYAKLCQSIVEQELLK